ncbi:MAG: helicase C-terminal domain-containing protein, partial [Pseudomonadota bacterium]
LVLSTATIALQEQLLTKDIDLVREITGWEIKPALAKGRLRYVCDRRLVELVEGGSEDAPSLFEVPPTPAVKMTARALWKRRQIGSWDGDIDAWSETIPPAVHAAITVPGVACSGPGCPQHASCAVFAARQGVRTAEIIVANASLVMADIASGGGLVLPKPGKCVYIFDEAHHLPEVARRQFEVSVDVGRARRSLRQIGMKLSMVTDAIDEIGVSLPEDLQPRAMLLEQSYGEAEQRLLQEAVDEEAALVDADSAWHLELMQETQFHGEWLDDVLSKLLDHAQQSRSDAGDAVVNEFGRVAASVESLARLGRLWCYQPDPDPIARWVKADLKAGDVSLNAAPVDASSLLRKRLWSECGAAVLTSATLRSLGSFDMLKRDVGFRPDSRELALESPFDLKTQGRFEIHPDACSPRKIEQHTSAIVKALPDLLEGVRGALVLFASYRQLEEVSQRMPGTLAAQCLVQNTLPRHELLEKHRESVRIGDRSVIMGVQSFGEGLDLPGEECEIVVIAKLPFVVPSDPVEVARSRWLERRGRNPFLDDALPRAHRTLVQWCGRLIRSETDTGRIVIFDSRLGTERWGRQMLETLPPFARGV